MPGAPVVLSVEGLTTRFDMPTGGFDAVADLSYTVRRGDRIAQMVVAPVVRAELCEADTLNDSRRGPGGFGHTGVE